MNQPNKNENWSVTLPKSVRKFDYNMLCSFLKKINEQN